MRHIDLSNGKCRARGYLLVQRGLTGASDTLEIWRARLPAPALRTRTLGCVRISLVGAGAATEVSHRQSPLEGRMPSQSAFPNNGERGRCMVMVDLDQNVPLTYHRYEIQQFMPAEFALLLDVGPSVRIALEQSGN
jgi:hypothetical protein